MNNQAGGSDGRITNGIVLSRIEGRLDVLEKKVDQLAETLKSMSNYYHQLEINQQVSGNQIVHLEKDICNMRDDLEKTNSKVNNWNGLNSVGVMIASLLNVIGINKP